MQPLVIFSILQVVISVLSLILVLIILPSNYWSYFFARSEIGIPLEKGRFGFWSVCTSKPPFHFENCDAIDTLFHPPPLIRPAGVLAIILSVTLAIFAGVSSIRVQQVIKGKAHITSSSRTMGIAKVTLAVGCFILASLIIIFTTVYEESPESWPLNRLTTYQGFRIYKGWPFWVHIGVSGLIFLMVILCVLENFTIGKMNSVINFTMSGGHNQNNNNHHHVDPRSGSPNLLFRHPTSFQSENICLCCPLHGQQIYTVPNSNRVIPKVCEDFGNRCTSRNCQLDDVDEIRSPHNV